MQSKPTDQLQKLVRDLSGQLMELIVQVAIRSTPVERCLRRRRSMDLDGKHLAAHDDDAQVKRLGQALLKQVRGGLDSLQLLQVLGKDGRGIQEARSRPLSSGCG